MLFNTDVTDALVADLSQYGRVGNKLLSIDAVTMSVEESQLDTIRALPYVAAANPDAERLGAPVDTVSATNFASGFNTWDNDAINVTQIGTLANQLCRLLLIVVTTDDDDERDDFLVDQAGQGSDCGGPFGLGHAAL